MDAPTMTTAITSYVDVVTSVMTFITGNATLMVFLCAGLVGMAISTIKKLVGRY